MQALQELADFGAQFQFIESESSKMPGVRPDAVVEVSVGSVTARFAVEERQRAPYLNEISRLRVLREAFENQGRPMLSAPFIREAVGASLTNSGWSWADDQGNLDIRAPGLVLRQRRTSELPRSTFKQLPQGNGGLAIIRALIRETMRGEGTKTAYLANESHVSQPRVSQVLRQLEDLDLLDRSNNRDWEIDRTSLIDLFDSEYKGPGGSEQFYYVLDSPTEMAIRISRIRDINTFVVSADVGPDLIAPWRRPSSIIVYGSPEFSTVGLDMVAAQGQHDANVIVRLPQDTSVFPSSPFVVELSGTQIPLADPTQMLWDMKQLGGDDRLEAADHLREWLLRSR